MFDAFMVRNLVVSAVVDAFMGRNLVVSAVFDAVMGRNLAVSAVFDAFMGRNFLRYDKSETFTFSSERSTAFDAKS